jgi:hypothetical protein
MIVHGQVVVSRRLLVSTTIRQERPWLAVWLFSSIPFFSGQEGAGAGLCWPIL